MIYNKTNDLPKNRRRKAQIEKILDTAMKIVTNEGVDFLTIQNLANKLDYTPGALYRYYSSKDEIIAEMQIKCIQEFNILFDNIKSKVDEHFNNNEIKPILLIILISELFGKYAFEEPVKFGFLTNIIVEPKVLVNDNEASKVINEFKNLFIKISILFFESINKKLILSGNPAEISLVYLSSLQGILQLKKLTRIEPSLFNMTSLRKNITKTLLLGWGLSEDNFEKANKYLLETKII